MRLSGRSGNDLGAEAGGGGQLSKFCAERQWHGAQEVRGVVLLVEHLVADERPARRLDHLHVQPLLGIRAQRVRHDQRRGAGDRDEADLQVGPLEQAELVVLRHGLQGRDRQHAADGGHRGASADCAEEVAAQGVLREQRLDERGLDEGVE